MTYSSYPVSGGGGSGDVQGPVLSVNNGVVLFDGTSGKTIKDLGVGSANQVLVTDGTTPSFALIADANVSGSAAIAYSKLAALTASRALQSSAGGIIEVSSVTSTELGYVSGVTSSIQTQLNAKEPTISLTANRAVVSSAGGTLAVSATTDTEIGYVSGVTSAIQTQIDSKTGIADNETITGNWTFNNIITGSITGNAGTVTNGAYINVTNSFTSTQNILATTNQLVLGTTNTTTISATAPASSAVYTIPDVGTTADFVMTAGAQTIGGAKTFSDDLIVGSNALFVDVSAGNVGIGTASPASSISASARVLEISSANAAVLALNNTGASGKKWSAFADAFGSYRIRNESDTIEGFQIGSTGAVTLGPSGFTGNHIANANTFTLTAGASSEATLAINSAASQDVNLRWQQAGVNRWNIYHDNSNSSLVFYNNTGVAEFGSISSAGAWKLGPSTNLTSGFHSVKGSLRCDSGQFGSQAVFTGSSVARISTNSYGLQGVGYFSALSTVTGYSAIITSRPTAAGNESVTFLTNYQDAQTAGAALVTTNERKIGFATAAGAWTLGPSSGLDGSHLIRSNRTTAGHNVSSFWAQHNTLSASLTAGIVDIGFTAATPSSTSQTYIRFFNNGDADIGGVRHATANSVSYQTSSDLRKKENIQVLENALDVINSVSAKRFTWKLDKVNDVGFIAQEMLEVTPNAVGGSDEGTYSMDYSRVTPYLWNAVRELHAELQTLKGA